MWIRLVVSLLVLTSACIPWQPAVVAIGGSLRADRRLGLESPGPTRDGQCDVPSPNSGFVAIAAQQHPLDQTRVG